jgi:alpha-glucosidase
MRLRFFLLTAAVTFGAMMAKAAGKTDNTLTSPDGRNTVTFSISEAGEPVYSVSRDGKAVINPSIMGFTEKQDINLAKGYKVDKILFDTKDEEWTQPWGENKQMREHYNEMAVNLKNHDSRLTLRFRAFDDGIGFRYEVNVPQKDSLFIMDELTRFNFADNAKSWSIPASADTYELLYREMPVGNVDTANTPFTFRTSDGVYGSIHEAALYDFPEMTLAADGGTTLKAALTPWPDGVKARKENTFNTSWRTLQLGSKAVDLINSGLILNLNPPCVLTSTEWIEPMKYVGVWWGMHTGIESWIMGDRHGATTENTKRYIDFAAKNGIRGVLVEGWNDGWQNWGGSQVFDYTKPFADFDIEELVKYAAERGVVIIGHHETGGNMPVYERDMDAAYNYYRDLGIMNVKTGYAGGIPGGQSHHGQYGVRHYQKVLEQAADKKMTINAHEPIKDTGIRRTWPNMMSREGARGMEWNAWSEGNPPNHHEILPFTRLLSGPMDYTPGTFDILLLNTKSSPDFKPWNGDPAVQSRVNTTLAKQLANWVILYSPVQMASDLIEHYDGHPAFQFFVDYDADCDWSKALAGEPNEYVVVARRADDKFFIGASTNEEARTVTVALDFLEPDRAYRATIYADAPDADWVTNPTAYTIEHKILNSKDSIEIKMAPGGGQAITFEKMK